MNVLVVDDDLGARALMRRVLVRDFNVNVIEADDGVTGLERLLAEPIDLLLLDIRMRVMDGLRTLEAVRRSPKYSTLQVVMLTGMADQERVTRAMQLGVTDFIVKPLNQSTLRERLARFIQESPQAGVDPATRPDVKASDRVIIVDHEADFREFFADTLSICTVEGADSELAALKQCQGGPVAALFVGTLTGQLDQQVFLQTLRDTLPSRAIPIIAVVRSRELETARTMDLYDGVIVRSFETESFTRSLTHVLSEATIARLLMSPGSTCVASLLDFGCSKIGGLLQRTLTAEAPDSVSLPNGARWLFGSLTVTSGAQSWELRLHLPFGIALQIAGVLRQAKTDEISEAQVIAAAGELTTQLGAHLREAVGAIGPKPRTSPVRVGWLPAAGALPVTKSASNLVKILAGPADDPAGVIQLLPRTGTSSGEHS